MTKLNVRKMKQRTKFEQALFPNNIEEDFAWYLYIPQHFHSFFSLLLVSHLFAKSVGNEIP